MDCRWRWWWIAEAKKKRHQKAFVFVIDYSYSSCIYYDYVKLHDYRWAETPKVGVKDSIVELIQTHEVHFCCLCLLLYHSITLRWCGYLLDQGVATRTWDEMCLWWMCFGWSGFEHLNKKTPVWIRMRIHQVSENWNINSFEHCSNELMIWNDADDWRKCAKDRYTCIRP